VPSPTSLPKASLLRLGRHEQDHLLFAVELLNAPVSEKETLLGLSTVFLEEGLLRPVTITVRDRPYCGVPVQGDERILDIAPRLYTAVAQTDSEVLPEPPLPFKFPTCGSTGQSSPVAGTDDLQLCQSLDRGPHTICIPSSSPQVHPAQAEAGYAALHHCRNSHPLTARDNWRTAPGPDIPPPTPQQNIAHGGTEPARPEVSVYERR
jgi:hypothetical protein